MLESNISYRAGRGSVEMAEEWLYGTVYFVSEIYEKMGSELTGKFLKNRLFNRVLAPGTYLDRFLLQNRVDSTIQTSISIFLDPIRPRFAVFLDFSRKKNDPNFLRSGQSLLKRQNHPSSLSSIPIGLLHT